MENWTQKERRARTEAMEKEIQQYMKNNNGKIPTEEKAEAIIVRIAYQYGITTKKAREYYDLIINKLVEIAVMFSPEPKKE